MNAEVFWNHRRPLQRRLFPYSCGQAAKSPHWLADGTELWWSEILPEMEFDPNDDGDIGSQLLRPVQGAAAELPFLLSAPGCVSVNAASRCHPKGVRRLRHPGCHRPS